MQLGPLIISTPSFEREYMRVLPTKLRLWKIPGCSLAWNFAQMAFRAAYRCDLCAPYGAVVIPIEQKSPAVAVGLTWDAKPATPLVGGGR